MHKEKSRSELTSNIQKNKLFGHKSHFKNHRFMFSLVVRHMLKIEFLKYEYSTLKNLDFHEYFFFFWKLSSVPDEMFILDYVLMLIS